MNARENALRIIRFDHPECVMVEPPIHHIYYHGCNHHGFGDDHAHDSPVGARWFDIWGTGWHKIHEGVMGLPKIYPLADTSNLNTYQWPDPDDERICGAIYQTAAQQLAEDRFLTGHHRDTLWEKAYMLVGMENLMVYFYTEPAFARDVLHGIMDFQMGVAEHYLNAGVDFVKLSDDLGIQNAPLLNPRTVNEFLVPEYRRLFNLYKRYGVLIDFHSCGHIEPFIDMFIELGVDILNPLQATANDLSRIRHRTQRRMALRGGISSAIVMNGPVERIDAEVHHRIWQLGQEGGYFCGPDQSLPYPQAHLNALYEAIERHGSYPLIPPDPEQ
ncbi:MAG: hypothetical protein GX620_00600 [Chloroflexi bacterium]|nr:hypothetical protein [Chloroflexota bacterium]